MPKSKKGTTNCKSYGSVSAGKLPRCGECKIREYCVEGADTASKAIEYDDEIGTLASDPVLPDSAAEPEAVYSPGEAYKNPEFMEFFRQVLGELIDLSKGNPVRIFILIARISGASYEAIGAKVGMSKQGISKHVSGIIAVNPALKPFLNSRYGGSYFAKGILDFGSIDLRKNNGNIRALKNE